MNAIYLPDNCPPRLRRVIEKHGGRRHRITRELGVNVYWIQAYIKHWKEPSNPDTRARMYLPKTQRKPRQPKHRPEHINWWRHLDPLERDKIIRGAYYDHATNP